MITKEESTAINKMRFICMVFLVILHTRVDHLVNLDIAQDVKLIEDLVGIPFLNILFLISGYLFFNNGGGNFLKNTYPNKLKSRIKTLLIPFFIWCITGFFFRKYVKGTFIPTDDIIEFIKLFWNNGTGDTIGMGLWYVRNLMVFAILSPIYYYVVKVLKHFTIVIILFLAGMDMSIMFPFFNVYLLIGAYLSISGINLESISKIVDWRYFLIFYIASDIVNNFYGEIVNFNLMALSCMMGLYGAVKHVNISPRLIATSTLIYFLHFYFNGLRTIIIKIPLASESIPVAIIAWFLTAAIVLTICISSFYIAKRFAFTRKLLAISTGDRA